MTSICNLQNWPNLFSLKRNLILNRRWTIISKTNRVVWLCHYTDSVLLAENKHKKCASSPELRNPNWKTCTSCSANNNPEIKLFRNMESKSYYNPDSLYNQCIMCYVKNLKPKTSQLDGIGGLQILPPNILADIYLAVSTTHSKFSTFFGFCVRRRWAIAIFTFFLLNLLLISDEWIRWLARYLVQRIV